jgi:hypothetical protein
MYITITPQDTINQLAQHVVHRENEVHGYQLNIDNFNQILSTLPTGEVPSQYVQYVGAKPENHTKVEDLPLNLSDDDIAAINAYQFRVSLLQRIRSEKAEQSKAKLVLDALKAQIPPEQLDILVAEAVLVVNAQQPTT